MDNAFKILRLIRDSKLDQETKTKLIFALWKSKSIERCLPARNFIEILFKNSESGIAYIKHKLQEKILQDKMNKYNFLDMEIVIPLTFVFEFLVMPLLSFCFKSETEWTILWWLGWFIIPGCSWAIYQELEEPLKINREQAKNRWEQNGTTLFDVACNYFGLDKYQDLTTSLPLNQAKDELCWTDIEFEKYIENYRFKNAFEALSDCKLSA